MLGVTGTNIAWVYWLEAANHISEAKTMTKVCMSQTLSHRLVGVGLTRLRTDTTRWVSNAKSAISAPCGTAVNPALSCRIDLNGFDSLSESSG